MANRVLPRVHAMVLCDGIEESAYELDVFHLTSVRSIIESPFPAVVASFCVYLQMSGHHGEAACHVEIEETATSNAVFATAVQIVAFDEPTTIVPVVFRMHDCVFPAPGLYYVQLFDEEKLIGERPLQLRQES